ncbi:hypothetical protein INCEPTION_27 [Proteus phage vB_PmiS_Inception]|nr:hypothetical protein INCEPTION_27 [Proteus phage vB_PmiS_Inception]
MEALRGHNINGTIRITAV